MGSVEPSAYPKTPDSLAQGPHIVWSTFKDWSSLGRDLHGRFTAALELGDELRRGLADHLKGAPTAADKARLVAGFVADSTRHVDYESGWWPALRSATRTWETAYGNRIDFNAYIGEGADQTWYTADDSPGAIWEYDTTR